MKELTLVYIKENIQRKAKYLKGIRFDEKTINAIAPLSSGDLRSAINILEVAYYGSSNNKETKVKFSYIKSKAVFFSDAKEERNYNELTSFQKSILWTDVDTSL